MTMNIPKLGQTILYRDPMLYDGQVVAIVTRIRDDGVDLITFPPLVPVARAALKLDDSNWEPVA